MTVQICDVDVVCGLWFSEGFTESVSVAGQSPLTDVSVTVKMIQLKWFKVRTFCSFHTQRTDHFLIINYYTATYDTSLDLDFA